MAKKIDNMDLATECLEIVPQATRAIRSRVRASSRTDVTVPQFRTLVRLRRGAKTNKQLAEDIGLSVAAMSRLVQQLAVAGLITRSTDPRDRREVWIDLSPRGASHVKKYRSQAAAQIAERLSELSESEKNELQKGLRILLSTLC